MGDNDPRNVPIFPSLVFISAPIIGVTALLCWATIHNRRGFVTRFPNRPTEDGMLLFEDDRPGLYEIWIENNFDSPYRDLEGRDPPMQIRDPHGKLGDPRSLVSDLPPSCYDSKPKRLTISRSPAHTTPVGTGTRVL
jgi:hypothetical protein